MASCSQGQGDYGSVPSLSWTLLVKRSRCGSLSAKKSALPALYKLTNLVSMPHPRKRK